jgi:hypothetical protein
MTTRWNDLVALAREVEQARRDGKTIDPRKARRLARAVLELEHAPARSDRPDVGATSGSCSAR